MVQQSNFSPKLVSPLLCIIFSGVEHSAFEDFHTLLNSVLVRFPRSNSTLDLPNLHRMRILSIPSLTASIQSGAFLPPPKNENFYSSFSNNLLIEVPPIN